EETTRAAGRTARKPSASRSATLAAGALLARGSCRCPPCLRVFVVMPRSAGLAARAEVGAAPGLRDAADGARAAGAGFALAIVDVEGNLALAAVVAAGVDVAVGERVAEAGEQALDAREGERRR